MNVQKSYNETEYTVTQQFLLWKVKDFAPCELLRIYLRFLWIVVHELEKAGTHKSCELLLAHVHR
jgi:hypothetical protein